MFDLPPFTMDHLEGISAFNVVWVELASGSKHTARTWDYYENLHAQRGESRLDLAVGWLRQRKPVGYLVRNGLWVLDLDIPDGFDAPPMLERLDDLCASRWITGPRVQTPSGGLHAAFRLPDELASPLLKNHVCHPKEDEVVQAWDFKFGPRTLMVAPGSVTPKGIYAPLTPWVDPPLLNPMDLAPQLEIYRNPEPFFICLRPLEDRIMRAQQYLRHKAPVSISHSGGKRQLYQVAVHLVAYLDLDPPLAAYLLTKEAPGRESWNERCKDQEGKPCPWTSQELYHACLDALDDIPQQGVLDYKILVRQEELRWSLADFIDMLTFLPSQGTGTFMMAADLYAAFQDQIGVELPQGWRAVFGEAITHAIRKERIILKRRLYGKARQTIYEGVNAETLAMARMRWESNRATRAAAA